MSATLLKRRIPTSSAFRISHSFAKYQTSRFITNTAQRYNMAKLELNLPKTRLPDGAQVDMLGYGTGTAWYKSADDGIDKSLVEAVKTAVKVGYRHLDGAEVYNTEVELGKAIKECGVPREELFVTTKVMTNIGDIPSAIDKSLKKLGLTHVDLYLIHAPFFAKGDKTVLQSKWKDMEAILKSGKAKAIGVSNFLQDDIEAVLEICEVRPAVNQIEFHPYLQHGDLLSYHKNKDIRVAAYAPQTPITKATGGPIDEYVASLAKKYGVNPGEIILRWVIERGVIAITTSSKEQRMSDMLRVAAFSLTPKETQEISDLGNKHHFRAYFSDQFDKDDRR